MDADRSGAGGAVRPLRLGAAQRAAAARAAIPDAASALDELSATGAVDWRLIEVGRLGGGDVLAAG